MKVRKSSLSLVTHFEAHWETSGSKFLVTVNFDGQAIVILNSKFKKNRVIYVNVCKIAVNIRVVFVFCFYCHVFHWPIAKPIWLKRYFLPLQDAWFAIQISSVVQSLISILGNVMSISRLFSCIVSWWHALVHWLCFSVFSKRSKEVTCQLSSARQQSQQPRSFGKWWIWPSQYKTLQKINIEIVRHSL